MPSSLCNSNNKVRGEWAVMVIILIGASLSIITQATALLPGRNSHISNGEKANTNEFPFIVSLQQASDGSGKSYGHMCGASILNSQYLLTAAHCFSGSLPWIAVYGGNSINDPARKFVKVKSINIHPLYSNINERSINDIAIVQLESDITLDDKTVKAVNVEIGSIPLDFKSIVAGWGTVSDSQAQPSDLMKVSVPVVGMSYCDDLGLGATSPKQICAGDGNGHDSCQGDSGGPLFYKVPGSTNDFVVFGIVSYGPSGCGTVQSLTNRGIYTNITSYVDYIQSFTTSISTKDYSRVMNGATLHSFNYGVTIICIISILMSLIL